MTLHSINIDLPSDILLTLNKSEGELKKRLKLHLTIQLYLEDKVTIGKAAQTSGLTRIEFETVLAKNKISISNLSLEDVLGDLEKIHTPSTSLNNGYTKD